MTRSSGSLASNLLAVTLPLSAVIFGGVYLLSRSLIAAGVVAGIFLSASAVSNVRFFNEFRRRQGSTGDAAAVEVIEVEADRVLDIEPLGSHGPALCFFLGEGRALLLIGQWLLEQRSFPTKTFRLHRWADSKQPIRIESLGARITPEHSTVRLRSDHRIGDVEVFEATPDTLQADLDRAFGGRG